MSMSPRIFPHCIALAASFAVASLHAQPAAPGPRHFKDTPVNFRAPAGVRLVADVNYRDGDPVWRLDLAVPTVPADGPRPVIINIHGGGWSAGDKNGGRGTICRWAQRGYIGVSVRYRLLGEAPFPACIEDVKCAVRWLRAHAADYGIDPDRIGVFGHSAGAHLAAMLGACPASAGFDTGPWPEQSSRVAAVCALATPTDLTGRELNRFHLASPEENLAAARRCSPLTYASTEAPPFLLIHGNQDGTVPVDQAQLFAAALRSAGAANVTLLLLDALGHDPLITHEAILRPAIDAFFDTTIGPHAGTLTRQLTLGSQWQRERMRPGGFDFRTVEKFDRDADGHLTPTEWPASDEMFHRIDRGQNNAIEPAEMEAWRGGRNRAPRPGRE
jgi:acetyl esterase/lipase